ncbi:MAG: class I SAM-dependent methyltransferase [Clostridia bacterium]|nr:class I SAM-dependent methyltransferase [Clostridia bacterium]
MEPMETLCHQNSDEDTESYQVEIVRHYDALIDEDNDPVRDPPALKAHMDGWDGDTFMDALQLSKEKRVLEIGVGTGRLAVRAAPLCKSFCGIDLSVKTIERAKENLSGSQSVRLICGDFLTCEFKGSFDVIYSSLTFMHIREKEAAIRKAAALLSESGRFVLSIEKSQATVLTYGQRKIRIYPERPENIARYIKVAGLNRVKQLETEFAWILVGEK